MSVRAASLGDSRERERILRFLADHADAGLFHHPGWSRAVERGCGGRSHYLVSEDKAGALNGLLPLSEIHSRFFGHSMVSVGFGVGGGILADDEAAVQALSDAAWALACDRGCSGVELRGGRIPRGDWQRQEGVYANFAADLPAGDEAIFRSIRKRQRAEVRRAQAYGLEFRGGRSKADLDAHYRVYSTSLRNHGTPAFPRALFGAMLDEFGEDADILTAWKDGKPLSSVFTFYFKGTACPFWGGGTAEARRWRANEATYYELMCRASRRGCTRFDYGRSKLGTGPYAFKRNWGFEPEPLVYAVRTASGTRPREMNPLNPRYRLRVALWRKLPLAVANRVGPYIARGLG
jgi:FemAB-related protein (PEP-CTERM system-associated)